MNGLTPNDLIGKTITFTYEGNDRHVSVEQVKECRNGSTIIVGRDFGRDDAYRSFNVNKVELLSIER